MSKQDAQEYPNSIFKLYVSRDVDFIKVDDMARPYRTAEVEGYEKAIANCGRPMPLSISPGETALSAKDHVKQHARMWRMAHYFWDNWKMILQMFDYAKSWEDTGRPGHWPDCDMVQIGKLSKRGPVGPERFSALPKMN